jgi:hypothetical protein
MTAIIERIAEKQVQLARLQRVQVPRDRSWVPRPHGEREEIDPRSPPPSGSR